MEVIAVLSVVVYLSSVGIGSRPFWPRARYGHEHPTTSHISGMFVFLVSARVIPYQDM